jgi:hypothetical protein
VSGWRLENPWWLLALAPALAAAAAAAWRARERAPAFRFPDAGALATDAIDDPGGGMTGAYLIPSHALARHFARPEVQERVKSRAAAHPAMPTSEGEQPRPGAPLGGSPSEATGGSSLLAWSGWWRL